MEEFLRGRAVGVALEAPVGPVGLLCIRLALTQGQWPATAAGVGAATADAVFGAVAGLGLSLIQQFIIGNQTVLGVLGATIVIGLGIVTLRQPVVLDDRPLTLDSFVRDFATAFSFAITNPATFVAAFGLFAALGPVDPNVNPTAAILLIAGVFLGSALWWWLLARIAIGLRRRMTDNLSWINTFSGGLLLVFGAALLIGLAT